MSEPTTIEPGVTITWTRSLEDYRRPAWTLRYELVNAGARYAIPSTANADGVSHDVRIAPATSSTYRPGRYTLAGYVEDGTDTHRIFVGELVVSENILAGEPVDSRSQSRRTLEAIEATLENRATRDQKMLQIAGRAIQRLDVSELLRLRAHYQARVDREEGKSQGFLTNIAAEFGGAS